LEKIELQFQFLSNTTQDNLRIMENQNEMEQQQQIAQPQQRTMNMSEETKKIADEFVGLINGLFEGIEELTTKDRPINDGEWLEMSNTLMKLHRFKDRFMTNVVVAEQIQRHQRGRVLNRQPKTREEKLQDPKNMACPKCLRIITKRHYAEKHSLAGVCKAIEVVSNAVAKSGGEKKSGVNRVKISRNRSILLDIIAIDKRNDANGDFVISINKYQTKTSVFEIVLNIGEGDWLLGGSVKYGGERDITASCEYRKIAEGKWEKVVVEKPKIKITKRTLIKKKKVKLVVVNPDDDAEA